MLVFLQKRLYSRQVSVNSPSVVVHNSFYVPHSLRRHVEKVHRLQVRWYCCHECPIKYRKSYRLTKHLMEAHHLQWLKGHKRFQYVLEDDGCYRLQTVRYESTDENASAIQVSTSDTDRESKDNSSAPTTTHLKVMNLFI